MALADLMARLECDAQSQVDAIARDADAQVRAIEAATEEAVASLTAHHLERERSTRLAAYQVELALARREAHARELEARRALIERVLARARAHIPTAAASPAYAEALPGHVDDALSFLEGLEPRVRCQAAFAPALEAVIDRHPGARLVIDESVGPGVIAEAADGSVSVDNTLAARLDRACSRLAMALSRRLNDADH